jgi:OFA family oxalate/formate antiporter-like MFS transporter
MREDRGSQTSLASALSQRLPFYGWIVLASVCCAAFSRAGPAVATLSIFVTPMASEFGWSRAELSGAVSLGGVFAAVLSPTLGSLLDRRGPRLILCTAVLMTAAL